ncbi:hypothetical protein [Actinomyces naeslundii]|uniref:hypothetical protein n=1 Tax=Actinomyces naeslundii TaxID=1655 RepID=UPI002116FFE3|nr:hypothetical protein [Actinomyces naeslundii]
MTGGRAAAQTAADKRDVIRVVGAHENNLRGVDVVIPKRRLTVFTGVSGSGKSSLVFATIAAESRRLINETYPAFVQGFMDASARPDVDHLGGTDTGDRRGPGAYGIQSALHAGNRQRRRGFAEGSVLHHGQAVHRLIPGLRLQCSVRYRWWRGHHAARRTQGR